MTGKVWGLKNLSDDEARRILTDLVNSGLLSRDDIIKIKHVLSVNTDTGFRALLFRYKIFVGKTDENYVVGFSMPYGKAYIYEDGEWEELVSGSSKREPESRDKVIDFEFEDVVDTIVRRFLIIIRAIKDGTNLEVPPGELYHVDYYRRSIVLFFPLKENLYHAVVIHVCTRKWYTPKSRVWGRGVGHYYSACNALHKAIQLKRRYIKPNMVRDRTIVLIGPSYTKSVKGEVHRLQSKITIACWVIKKVYQLKEILKRVWRLLYNYLKSRLQGLQRAFEDKDFEPFGEVKEFITRLEIFVEHLRMDAY